MLLQVYVQEQWKVYFHCGVFDPKSTVTFVVKWSPGFGSAKNESINGLTQLSLSQLTRVHCILLDTLFDFVRSSLISLAVRVQQGTQTASTFGNSNHDRRIQNAYEHEGLVLVVVEMGDLFSFVILCMCCVLTTQALSRHSVLHLCICTAPLATTV